MVVNKHVTSHISCIVFDNIMDDGNMVINKHDRIVHVGIIMVVNKHNSTVLPNKHNSTVLPNKHNSTELPNKHNSTVLLNKHNSTVLLNKHNSILVANKNVLKPKMSALWMTASDCRNKHNGITKC